MSVFLYLNSKTFTLRPFSALFQFKIIKQPLKPMPKRFLHFMLLFPFYSAWWLRSNVIDDTVYMVYFINYTTRNFCNTSQSIRAKSLVIPSIDVTARILLYDHTYDNHP